MAIRARVYLVRHGETDGNRKKIIQGQLDYPLNQMGLDQAACVAEVLRTIKFDVALSSDLSRATETAVAILKGQPGLALQEQEELRERFMGDLQGQVFGTRPGGKIKMETGPALVKRAVTWWRRNIVGYTASLVPREEPYNILAVSHGGFLGTLMKSLIEAGDLELVDGVVLVASLPNASVSLIEWDGLKGRVLRYGDDGHLARAGRLEQNADELPI